VGFWTLLAVFLLSGCSDSESHDATVSTGPDSAFDSDAEVAILVDVAPPELVGDELYEVELRPGVVQLDLIPRFLEATLSRESNCAGGTEPQTESAVLQFGYPCTSVRVAYERGDDLGVAEGDVIFSPHHRLTGVVESINTTFVNRRYLKILPVALDDVFQRVRVRAFIEAPLMEDSSLEETNAPLKIHRQALEFETDRRFLYEDTFEQNLNTTVNPLIIRAGLRVVGQVKLDVLFGYGVPDSEEFVDVKLDMEAAANGAFSFSSGYDNVREASTTPRTFAVPLRFGWIFADLVFEAQAKLNADFNVRAEAGLEWNSSQSVSSASRWSPGDGWSSMAESEAVPLQTTARLITAGKLTASTGVELSAALVLYKVLGPKISIEPKLEAEGKGQITLQSSDAEPAAEGCLKISGSVGVKLVGVVRGLDDTALYEQTLVESEIASAGECEDIVLPMDEEIPEIGFQFSSSSVSPGGSCQNHFSGLDDEWSTYLRNKAEECNERETCLFSLQTCQARFPNRPLRGICGIDSYPTEFFYYQDVFECPEEEEEGFLPCTLIRAQEFGDVEWSSSCD